MSDLITRAKNLKLQYNKSSQLTPDVFNSLVDLIISNLVVANPSETAISIRNKLQTLFGDDRLDVSAIKNIVSGGAGTAETPESIRDKLQSLQSFSRLDATAIKNLIAANITYATSPSTTVSVQTIIDQILQSIQLIITDGNGDKFLNDKGEYIFVDWSVIANKPTKTSDFTNDGSDSTDVYVEMTELLELLANVGSSGYYANFGDGTATTFSFSHQLDTKDLTVQIYEVSTGQQVRMQINISTVSIINVSCNTPPTTNQYRIVVKK